MHVLNIYYTGMVLVFFQHTQYFFVLKTLSADG
jgi:hypothetical protein